MTALTETEIRAAVESALDSGDDADLHSLIVQAAARPLVNAAVDTLEVGSRGVWEPLRDMHEDALWRDLRPSEAARLMALVQAAVDRAEDRCLRIILEELVSAGIAFATEYPDAPRASTKPLVSAAR